MPSIPKSRRKKPDPDLVSSVESVSISDLVGVQETQRGKGWDARSPAERVLLSAKIARLMVRGFSGREIAAQVEISESTAYDYMKRLESEWRNDAMASLDTIKGREIAKLDHIETEAWAEFEKSKTAKRRVLTRSDIIGDGDKNVKLPTEQRQTTEERLGDTRYLDVVFKCIQLRIKLLGLDDVHPGNGKVNLGSSATRLNAYLTLVSPDAHFSPAAPVGDDDSGQPVDSERPALEAGGIFDTTGHVR